MARREIVEQSACFVFQNGKVKTYNEEVYCSAKVKLPKDFVAAVQARPLLELLRKLPDDEIGFDLEKAEVLVTGRNRSSGIRAEKEILNTFEKIEEPKKWKPLHKEFTTAVKMTESCASKDQDDMVLTCIHLHPKWIEACDRQQLLRYKMDTGVSAPVLVRRDSVKGIVPLDVTEFQETDHWMYFRNPAGYILACRRFVEQYKDLNAFLKVDGSPATLPKGLVQACDMAQIFSKEESDDNFVKVELKSGRVRIKGVGQSGWYKEVKKLSYKGPPMSFLINPVLLQELVKTYDDCSISEKRLKVNGGHFTYVASLTVAQED